jgi:hypothetical protein
MGDTATPSSGHVRRWGPAGEPDVAEGQQRTP